MRFIREFIRLEATSGIILFIATLLALMISNSPWHNAYEALFDQPVGLHFGHASLTKPVLLWINEGLMTLFFLLVGLEIKRELLEGELSGVRHAILPGLAAVGGMLVPAVIYYLINQQDPIALRGWAIPTATDTAFALAVLLLLGARIAPSLKIFLMTLAIFDDIGAIAIIAIFYTQTLSPYLLLAATGLVAALILLNRFNVLRLTPYLIIGTLLWLCVLKSGVHATLSGIFLAFTIPLQSKKNHDSPAKKLESFLHPWVGFLVLPVFAFANAGVTFTEVTWNQIASPITLGIALGLFLGKQIGIFSASWISIRCGIAKLPPGVNFASLYGASLIAGIGFTMSLFIGSLAFGDTHTHVIRIGVMLGSLVSGLLGYWVLKLYSPKSPLK